MKKLLSMMIVIVAITTSCKKEHTCVCDITWKEPTLGYESRSYQELMLTDTKKKAKQECAQLEEDMTKEWVKIDFTYTGGCELE